METDNQALIIEFASRQECKETINYDPEFDSEDAFDPACAPCVARRMLGPLKCACGAWTLDRTCPTLYVNPVYHKPDECAEPPKETHCHYCKQPLPAPKAPPASPEET